MIVFALALLTHEPMPEPPAARAELCLAHVNAMIAEEAKATGRVAGPSWFVRDWWIARLPEADSPDVLTAEQRAALEASMPARKAADPDKHRAELQACVGEAIDGGALP